MHAFVARQNLSRPAVDKLHDWLLVERAKMSRHDKVAKAINYMFKEDGRWQVFTAFLDDERICLTNKVAERALRGVALDRPQLRSSVMNSCGNTRLFLTHFACRMPKLHAGQRASASSVLPTVWQHPPSSRDTDTPRR